MKGLFWILALFALAVAVALGARLNDGYVMLVVPPYRAEVSLNLLILALVLLFAALYATLRGLAMMFGKSRIKEAEQLYARAAQCTPADAMERLDVEAARAEVGG